MSIKRLVTLVIATMVVVVTGGCSNVFGVRHTMHEGFMGQAVESMMNFSRTFAASLNVRPAADWELLSLPHPGVQTACGVVLVDNGGYCGETDIIWLGEVALDNAYDKAGMIGVYSVGGHEFGHHLQYVWGSLELYQATRRGSSIAEIQADCFAGAFVEQAHIAGLVDDPLTANLDPLFESIGSRPGTSFDPHGTAQQRSNAFYTGARYGAAAC